MTKRLLHVCMIPVLLTGMIFAQTSNTSVSTRGVFTNDVDNFVSVTDFEEVEGDFYFGGLDSGNLEIGFAREISSLYLGGWCEGNALYSNEIIEVTRVDTTPILDGSSIIIGWDVDTATRPDNSLGTEGNRIWSYNQFAVLVGTGDRGYKLWVGENTAAWRDVGDISGFSLSLDTATNSWTDLYDELSTGDVPISTDNKVTDANGNMVSRTVEEFTGGDIKSDVVWFGVDFGMKLDNLSPYFSLGGPIQNKSQGQVYTAYTQNAGSGVGAYEDMADITGYTKAEYMYGDNLFDLSTIAGVDVVLEDSGDRYSSFDVNYQFTFPLGLGGTAYTDTNGNTQSIKGKAASFTETTYVADLTGSTETVTRIYQVDNFTRLRHTLTPSYYQSMTLTEGLEFGFFAVLPIFVGNSSSNTEGELVRVATYTDASGDPSASNVVTTVKTYKGDTVSTRTFEISAGLDLGIQYELIPGKLTLNGGAAVQLPAFSREVEKVTREGISTRTVEDVDGDGTVNTYSYSDTLGDARTETRTVTKDWNSASTAINGGFTLNLAKGIDFDFNFKGGDATSLALHTLSVQVILHK